MTKNEWKNNDKVFKKLIIQYDAEKEGFSIEEREKVNKLIGRYYAITTKRILFESTSSIEDLGQQIEGFIDELKIE